MNILFYNSNTNNTDVKNFCYSFFPSAKTDFENLSEKYPEHEFFVVAQKPGVFLLDLENGELTSKAEKVQYHLLEKETSPKDFASFIQKLKPDLAISVSYWLSPFDWLSLHDSLIAEYLSENNVKVLCNSLENQEMCFNKWETQLALEAKGFTVPKSIYLSHDLFWAERSNKSIIHNPYKELILYKLQKLDFPVVIKSLTGFSSYGMDVAKTFPEALHFLTQKSGNEDKIIQEYKDGLHFGLEIYGTKGSIVASGTLAQDEVGTVNILISDDSLQYDANQTRNEIVPLSLEGTPLGNMYTKEVEQFGDAIINDTDVPVSIESAIYDQKIVEAAYESSDNKKFVAIN